MSDNELMMKRMADMERRIQALEERTHKSLWAKEENKEEEMVNRYGERVDKTVAAKILGVTRTTVYAMLADGRLCAKCNGKAVSVRSIASFIESDGKYGTRFGRKNKNKEAMNGADTLEEA